VLCPKCGGSGINRHSDFACDHCDGLGYIDWMDVLMPWAICLLGAGLTLTLGKWVWELFSKK
jgi:hypothetical protein